MNTGAYSCFSANIILFCDKSSTEKFVPKFTPGHKHFLLFLSDIGLPGDEYLIMLVLQLEVLVSEFNKALPNILTESNIFSHNSHPLSGKFSR